MSRSPAGPEESPSALPRVVVVGLGPAGAEHTTQRAREALDQAPLVLLRTGRHPAAEPLVVAGAATLDHLYETAETFEDVYLAIVEAVVAAAAAHGSVAYAVPGSPLVLERSVTALRRDPRVDVEVVAGMSFLDLAWERLGIDPVEAHVRLVDAGAFAVDAAGDTGPLLVAQAWSRAVLSEVKLAVDSPPSRPVTALHHLGLPDEQVVEVAWEELDRSLDPDHLTCLYVPELAEPVAHELVALDEVVHVLRRRCPWDREQTHRSLVRHLLEEAYETIEAIDELGDPPDAAGAEHLEEELGDLLCQVMFHATLAGEEGLFSLADVARTTHDKLVHRHPHVFAGVSGVESADAVMTRWEQIKQVEKGRESLMDGIPAALPALALVAKLERKASSVDLGWALTGASAAELEALLRSVAGHPDADGLGALLLGVARLAAHAKVDPEDALRRAALAMRRRFVATERAAAAEGGSIAGLDPAARLALWREQGAGETSP
ncbi:MAG TPA: MazG family protein [Acidimicrobiales bacterium]|nr:MazG family protein [Acidimicrobiales bacterium]